jgi:hypothetical protein
MIRLTGLLCCPLMALVGVLGAPSAYATEGYLLSQSQAKLQESLFTQAQRQSVDEESFLNRLLPLRYQKHLKRSSDLQGLAESRASPNLIAG